MKRWIVRLYENGRKTGLPLGVEGFPPLVQRYFNNISAFEPAEFILRLVGNEPREVLVIGVGGGRDAYWLSLHGHTVTSIDIANQPDISRLVRADMALLPFKDGWFDRVVIADALEHTFDDRATLVETRRVLNDGGKLILNIPFGDDVGDHHVRVYSEATLRRLLEASGLRINDRIYRGGMPLIEQGVPGARHLFHGINLISYACLRRTFYERALRGMTEFDWRRGRKAGLRRFSRVHGAYVVAEKASEFRDFRLVNRELYENQIVHMSSSHLRRQGPRVP